MFDGVADQFHHLIATRAVAASSAPLPLHNLPLTFANLTSTPNASTTNAFAAAIFPGFDVYPSSSASSSRQHPHHLDLQQSIPGFLHHQLHHPTTPRTLQKDEEKTDEDDDELTCMKLLPPPGGEDRPWTDEEALALIRIRSGIENWFPEVTWEHVSRKLEELGFKRSAEKCKDKFEEENRFFDCNNEDSGCDDNGYGKNDYRILSELEQICHGDHGRNPCDPNTESNVNEMEVRPEAQGDGMVGGRDSKEKRDCPDEEALGIKGRMKRRRRQHRFEMFKRFCEEVVEKLMVQQEEMHNKLLDDLVKRDAEMIAREEEWKKREMDRINKELDTRANEQAIAGNRQATVIELLEKFTASMTHHKIPCPIRDTCEGGDGQSLQSIPSNDCTACTSPQPDQNEASTVNCNSKDTKTAPVSAKRISHATEDSPRGRKDRTPAIPGSRRLEDPEPPAATKVDDRETGSKRWPRDEVQALINLRSAIHNREKAEHNRISGSHGETPLWERVSRGMTELGYRRSAKRCKEKWENINKYFRKTRDVRKKRSGESRTCPYFQQLSSLYGKSDRAMPRPSTAEELVPGDAGDGAV